MCQAYEAEAWLIAQMENLNGRCPYGHLRLTDGMCYQGRLCASNDEYFRVRRKNAHDRPAE